MILDSVWLVDDDELSNFVNERIIKTEQFADTVVTFTNAGDALAALNAVGGQQLHAAPAIIFLDMDMPGLDGWDFLEGFKQLPQNLKKKIRVYMLSSSIFENDVQRARCYECLSDFISKPLTQDGLKIIGKKLLSEPG